MCSFQAMTIDEQIENLKGLGLVISNEEFARDYLSRNSYYRFIKAYSPFFKKNGVFLEGTRFEDIVDLYAFNYSLRLILMPCLEKIEINMRCLICNTFLEFHEVNDYLKQESFSESLDFENWNKTVERIYENSKNSPIYQNYCVNHNTDMPFYAFVELMSFGTLAVFYENMKENERKIIANKLNIKEYYLKSWLKAIASLRNSCAHYDRIYGKPNMKGVKLYKCDSNRNVDNQSLYANLLCMRYFFDENQNDFDALVKNIKDLCDSNKQVVNIEKMGFKEDWFFYLRNIDSSNSFVMLLEKYKINNQIQ